MGTLVSTVRMRSLSTWLLVAVVATVAFERTSAFYLPGVAPHEYFESDPIALKVNKLTSVHTLMPLDFYSLPFCRPPKIEDAAENLGEHLTGEAIHNSAYKIGALVNEECAVLCRKTLSAADASNFAERIQEEYRVHWIVDNLPAATHVEVEMEDGTTRELYEDGFALGFVGNEDVDPSTLNGVSYLYNHVKIQLLYHREASFDGSRIVGFEVIPYSIKHEWSELEDPAPPTCFDREGAAPQDLVGETEVVFTYEIDWIESDVKWASRWDTYLKMQDTSVHWFSITNSLIIVLFLSGMVAMVLMRALRKDFELYSSEKVADDVVEESGWKLIHGDVFRRPTWPMTLSVCVGTGIQILVMAFITLAFALLGFLSPANRGGLLTAVVVLFVLSGVFAGYSSARQYKMFGGEETVKCTVMTAVSMPGIAFLVFFIINLCLWGEKSSGAVPFLTLVLVMFLWLGISLPLVFLGSYFGFRKAKIMPPNGMRVNQIPRQIPTQVWYLQPVPSALMAGILPMGASFLELFFIFSSVWGGVFFYGFFFLFLTFTILITTSGLVALIFAYFSFVAEDHRWHWRAFFQHRVCRNLHVPLRHLFLYDPAPGQLVCQHHGVLWLLVHLVCRLWCHAWFCLLLLCSLVYPQDLRLVENHVTHPTQTQLTQQQQTTCNKHGGTVKKRGLGRSSEGG